MKNEHKHDLQVLWDGFDGWVLVKCKECDYMEYLFKEMEIK